MAFKGFQQPADPEVPLAGALVPPALPPAFDELPEVPLEPAAVPVQDPPSVVPVEEQPPADGAMCTGEDDGEGFPQPGTMALCPGADLRFFNLLLLDAACKLMECGPEKEEARVGAVVLAAWYLREPTRDAVAALSGQPLSLVRDVVANLRRGHYITGSRHTRGRWPQFDEEEHSGVAFVAAVLVGTGDVLRDAEDRFIISPAGSARVAAMGPKPAESGPQVPAA